MAKIICKKCGTVLVAEIRPEWITSFSEWPIDPCQKCIDEAKRMTTIEGRPLHGLGDMEKKIKELNV